MVGIDKSKGQQDRMMTIEDEKNRILPLRQMELVPPEVGIFDEPTRCYRINHEWAKIVMGMVAWLAEVAVWRDAENEGYSAIQEILRFKVGDNCMNFELRQNPENSCLLEQTLNGVDWIPVFDFSLCSTITDNSTTVITTNQTSEYFNNAFQTIFNYYVANYVDSPDDVYPDLSYGGSLDAELDAAYCNAIYHLVRVACDIAIAGIQELDEAQAEFNLGIAIVGFALTAIALAAAIPTGGASLAALAGYAIWWAPIIGITAAVANDLLNEWQDKTIDQYEDQAAQFEVVCYIVDNLSGDMNTHASMISTLAGHTLTGNAGVIADNLYILIQADASYAAFLEKWNNNLEYAEAGIELFCPCDEGEIPTDFWMIYQDFETGVGPWWDLQIGNLESDGIMSEDSSGNNIVHLRMELDEVFQAKAAGTVTKRRGSTGNGSDDDRIRAYPEADLGGTPQDIAYQNFINCNTDDCGTQEHVFGGGTQPCRSIWATVRDVGTFNASTNYVKLVKIVVYGLCNEGQGKPAQAIYVDAIPIAGEFFD